MDLTWWQILLGAVVGLFILTFLVVVHEFGHAIVAKRNGVEVEEFGIGFPPIAAKLGRVKNTLVTLNWLPLGGFCRMKGESDDATSKGSYGAASLAAKAKILLAGVGMNMLTACVLLTILAFWGIPEIVPNQFAISSDNHGDAGVVSIYSVVENSPADDAGLQAGDELLAIDDQSIELSTEVPKVVADHAGGTVSVRIRRDDTEQTLWVTIANEDNGNGRLGITSEQKQGGTIKATWSAPLVGVANALQFFWLTIKGIWNILVSLCQGLFSLLIGVPIATAELGAVSDSVAGPVGILGYIFPQAVAGGPLMLLYISSVVSISLAVMNLLPIPGLDGGRLYLTLWYRLRHKKLTKEREETIVSRGMMALFVVIILVTVLDILKIV